MSLWLQHVGQTKPRLVWWTGLNVCHWENRSFPRDHHVRGIPKLIKRIKGLGMWLTLVEALPTSWRRDERILSTSIQWSKPGGKWAVLEIFSGLIDNAGVKRESRGAFSTTDSAQPRMRITPTWILGLVYLGCDTLRNEDANATKNKGNLKLNEPWNKRNSTLTMKVRIGYL